MSDYQLQAQRIETTFGAYKIPARVWQATVTARFVRFDVTTALGTRITQVERLADELAMALGVSAVRVYRDGGVLHVEVPRDTPRTVALADLLDRVRPIPPLCGILGVDEGGSPLLVRMDSPDVAHILISGTTGSGKTVLLRSLLASLVRKNRPGTLQIFLADPKRNALDVFAGLPHIAGRASDPGEIVSTLARLVPVMESRERGALPHIVLAIDELAEIIMQAPESVDLLTRLTQRGREANIHVIAATQRPSAALVGGMVKANFPVRLVGSVASPEDAKVASGLAGSGAERLLGRGDFVLVSKGQIIRFQAAYADEAALTALLDSVGRKTRRPLSLALPPGGVGSGVGIKVPKSLFADVAAVAEPHPTSPRRRPLRERYTVDQLCTFLAANGGRLKDAAEAAFGYSDTSTLSLMREAQSAFHAPVAD